MRRLVFAILLFTAPCAAQSWYQSFDISSQPITGSLYDAHLLPNGDYLYAIGRGNSGQTGVEEVTPNGLLVFSWNDPTWRVPTNGPEYATKIANGDYIIVDGDAGTTNATYEMTPGHIKVWAWSGINYQAEPITFNGSSVVLMEPQGGSVSYAAILSYPSLARLWVYTVGNTNNFFALRGDFRVIGGKNKVLYPDNVAHTLNQIDVTNSTVDYSCAIPGLTAGPKSANYIDDQDVLVAEGAGGQHGGRVAVIHLPTCSYVQETAQFGGTTNSAYMIDAPQSQQWVASNCTSCVPSYTVTVVPLAGFTGNVSLTFSANAGFTGSFNPAVVTGGNGTSILSFTSAPTIPGTYAITITGTSGSLSHTTTANLMVLPAMDFAGSVTPSSQTVTAGNSTSCNVTVSSLRGFNSNVLLSVSGTPAGMTATFNPPMITGGAGSSVLNIATASTTTPGTYTLTLTGTGGGVTHSATVSLTVNPAP